MEYFGNIREIFWEDFFFWRWNLELNNKFLRNFETWNFYFFSNRKKFFLSQTLMASVLLGILTVNVRMKSFD